MSTAYNTESNRTCPLRGVVCIASYDGNVPPLFLYERLTCGHWHTRYVVNKTAKRRRCVSCREEKRP